MRQQYHRKKRAKHYHGCQKCNERYKCNNATCIDPDDSIDEECALCCIRSPAFREALEASHEEIRLEMEAGKVYVLSVFDKQAHNIHVMDHIFRNKQQAINYFEVHYDPLRYSYRIDYTDVRF
jgi:hypothetical protein